MHNDGSQLKAIWAVKLVGRVTNLEPPPPTWSREKRQAYLDEARFILQARRKASPTLEVRLEEKARAHDVHCR